MNRKSTKYVTKHSPSVSRDMLYDMQRYSHKVKDGGWAVTAFYLLSICALVSNGTALSIIVQNGTFEVGSLDAQIEVKITPKPETVLKVNWYHCSLPDACAKFYSVDNAEDVIETYGDLGDRSSHFVMNNDQEYIIFLVISKPKDNDQGEYRCQIQVAHEDKPLQGNLRLTKLEALSEASAENITAEVGAPVMLLSIKIFPSNTTLYWLKCFHSATPEPSAHFYTYNKNLNTVIAAGDLGTRTSHKADVQRQSMWLSLVIQNPNTGDAGPYCCQVDAVGMMEPRLVVMWVEIKGSSMLSSSEPRKGANNISILKQGIGPSGHFSILITLVCVYGAFIIILIGAHYISGNMEERRDNTGGSFRRGMSCSVENKTEENRTILQRI